MRDFRRLLVWLKAHRLALASHAGTAKFPREELYGLTNQIRRCAASVAAHISEGRGKDGNPEFHCFLQIASGSASELDSHVLLANGLSMLSVDEYQKFAGMVDELRRMLASWIRRVVPKPKAASS